MDIENAKAQMRKGVLELCILAIAADDEVYPGDIITRLKANDLIVVEGTLYPLLTRLKNDGLLDYSWRESNAGPPRKYFKTTDSGKTFLHALVDSWEQLVQSVHQTLTDTATEHSGNHTAAENGQPDDAATADAEQPESPYFT
jgi:PadR family transcriptional regulator, regulatory protein PadR